MNISAESVNIHFSKDDKTSVLDDYVISYTVHMAVEESMKKHNLTNFEITEEFLTDVALHLKIPDDSAPNNMKIRNYVEDRIIEYMNTATPMLI